MDQSAPSQPPIDEETALKIAEARTKLLADIDEKIGEVRTEAVDLTFGEIINLKGADEIRIDPEYQRLFRWSDEQKSRLVESVLLRLPIPPVFFIENEDGKLELIDGLQRISSICQFVDSSVIAKDPLRLEGCDIVKSLNTNYFVDLPLTLQLQLKRSAVRAMIIKRQSKEFLRYEMFKRLNTGGSELSEQEIRNCSARIFGSRGIAFYEFLIGLSQYGSFFRTTETLSDSDQEKRGREELVLRFFAALDGIDFYHGNVADWLNSFMEAVLMGKRDFDFPEKQAVFQRVFDAIERVSGVSAFCKYKSDRPIGGLAPAYYEAMTIGFAREISTVETKDSNKLHLALVAAQQSDRFRQNVGTGANKRSKLTGRVEVIEEAIRSA